MGLAAMAPAQRHGEFIAHFSPERAMLREPQVMGIGGAAAADQAWLFSHKLDVILGHESGAARDGPIGSCRCRLQRMSSRRALRTAAQLAKTA